MKNRKDVCVVVQARMGSERVPGKMLKPFAGTTIMDICLEKLAKSSVGRRAKSCNKESWTKCV